ncbi:MAG: hypothetical protein IMZ71_02760 [Chloroflexi bacterium]|nr:hypothetical protein [Chloroflexota bacterium]
MAKPTVTVGKSTKKTDVDSVVANTRMEIGAIIMFDANRPAGGSGGASGAWVDNETMPGWYACIAANATHGCPDLVDRFIMGKVVAGAGATGGSNTHTIASGELPVHTHDLGDHTHGIPGNVTAGTIAPATRSAASSANFLSTGPSTNISGNGGFANTAIDTKPAYYSVIYIRKCYDV